MLLLGVSLALVWGGTLGTQHAGAFVEESTLIEGTKLAKSVENLVKVPDFIPEVWEGGGGPPPPADEVGAWTDFWEAGGTVPVLGSVLAFGVGVGIGSVICNEVLELEGCWFYESTGSNPKAETSEGSWVSRAQGCSGPGGTSPAYAYYFTVSPGGTAVWCEVSWFGKLGNHETCGFKPAASGTFWPIGATKEECGSGPEANKYKYARGAETRDFSTNRKLEGLTKAEAAGKTKYAGEGYCPLAGPGSTSCASKPPSNWSEREATCLKNPATCGITEKQRDEIAEHIAANTPKGLKEGVKDPYATYVKVPSCSSTWSTCKTSIEELKLIPERDSLDWKTARLELGAAAVLTLSPSTGSDVKVGSKVVVETNPDSEGMPAVIPEPEPHETYAHYIARLSPSLDPTREVVSDANEDASAGPDAVLQVSPEPGTREDPLTTTEVDVQTNPHDAPAVPVESGGCDASVGSIDFSPLNRGLGNRFPFGLFTWAAGWLGEWPDGEEAPSWTLPIVPGGVFGGEGVHLHLAFGWLEPYIEPIRIVMLLATFVGIVWFLATAALKLQGDTS